MQFTCILFLLSFLCSAIMTSEKQLNCVYDIKGSILWNSRTDFYRWIDRKCFKAYSQVLSGLLKTELHLNARAINYFISSIEDLPTPESDESCLPRYICFEKKGRVPLSAKILIVVASIWHQNRLKVYKKNWPGLETLRENDQKIIEKCLQSCPDSGVRKKTLESGQCYFSFDYEKKYRQEDVLDTSMDEVFFDKYFTYDEEQGYL